MREILFRGKRTDNGEWVEGNLYIAPDLKTASIWWLDYSLSEDGMERWGKAESVDPETVGQYTGLTDKNGRKIFEGDIVIWAGEKFVVEYIDNFATFDLMKSPDNMSRLKPPLRACMSEKFYIVKGNIHDTPELLEVM